MANAKVGALLLCTMSGVSCHCESEEHASSDDGPVIRAGAVDGAELGSLEHRDAMLEILVRARRGGKSAFDYRVPTEDEVEAYAQWVVSAVGSPGEVPARPGFVSQALSADEGLWALLEEPRQKRGMGAVFVRRGRARSFLVQIPHSYFDVDTLALGVELFELLGARAAMVNTVHRYRATAGKKPPKGEHSLSDMAHAERSSYLSLHEAFVVNQPSLLTIQVHGFANDAAPGVDAIVSGSKTDLDLGPVVERLRKSLPGVEFRAYPNDIDRLGGTTNVEARASQRHNGEFLHLELSRAMRTRLAAVDAGDLRRALAAALLPLRPQLVAAPGSGEP